MRKKQKKAQMGYCSCALNTIYLLYSFCKEQIINNLITNSYGKRQKANPWKIKAE